MQLGQLFRAQRLRENLTQAQLSEKAQVSLDIIRALEAGKNIDEQNLLTLAAELGIPQQDVFAAMQETQQEDPVMPAYSRRAPQRAAQEPMSRMEEMPQEASRIRQDPYAQQRADEYVSPIPQDEDERLLQEIRRQRRRQAYEGTLRTQRRMNDTARMQEILRQQEQAVRTQETDRRQEEVYPRMDERPAPAFAGYEQREERHAPAFAGYEQREERPAPAFAGYENHQAQPSRMYEQERAPMREETYAQPQKEAAPQTPHMQDTARMPRQSASAYDAPKQTAPADDYVRMLHVAADIAQLSGRETVLEIGCGNGELTNVLAQRSRFVAVVDTSTRALENTRAMCAAQGYGNVDFLEGDARRLPIESGSFDVVYVHMLLHHVISAPQVLVEARRVLKPGGCVVVTEIMPSDVPAQRRIQNAVEVLKNPTHIGVIPMQDIMRMMQHAGLKVVDRRVLDQQWEFEQWVNVMGANETKEQLRALMRSFALQGNRAGMDLAVDKTGRMTFTYRWMYLVGVPER